MQAAINKIGASGISNKPVLIGLCTAKADVVAGINAVPILSQEIADAIVQANQGNVIHIPISFSLSNFLSLFSIAPPPPPPPGIKLCW